MAACRTESFSLKLVSQSLVMLERLISPCSNTKGLIREGADI
jgi:hypothetical protein